MTETEHNDEALRVAVTKIVDRLAQEHLEYEKRVASYQASITRAVNAFSNQTSAINAGASNGLGLGLGLNNGGYSVGNYMVPGWVPYLSAAEYETLKAWRDGDNMIIHTLAQPR